MRYRIYPNSNKYQEKSRKSLLNPIHATLSDRISHLKRGFESEYSLIESKLGKTDESSIVFGLMALRSDNEAYDDLLNTKNPYLTNKKLFKPTLRKNEWYDKDKVGPIPSHAIIKNPKILKQYLTRSKSRNGFEILGLFLSLKETVIASMEKELQDQNIACFTSEAVELMEKAINTGVFPLQSTIANRVGCHPRTVRRWLKKFQNIGLMQAKKQWAYDPEEKEFIKKPCLYKITNWFHAHDIVDEFKDILPVLANIKIPSQFSGSVLYSKTVFSLLRNSNTERKLLDKFFKIKKKIELEKHRKHVFSVFYKKYGYFPKKTMPTSEALEYFKNHESLKRVNEAYWRRIRATGNALRFKQEEERIATRAIYKDLITIDDACRSVVGVSVEETAIGMKSIFDKVAAKLAND